MCKRLLGLVLLAWVAQFSSWAQEAPAESAQPLAGGECYYDLLVRDRDMSVDVADPSWWDVLGRGARGLFEGWYVAMFGSEWNAAAEACRVAFEAGDARSGFWLAEYYGRLGRWEEAVDYLEKSAEQGDAYSLYWLGFDYFRRYPSTIPERDVERGFDYLVQAANKNYGEAQGIVAHIYDRVKDFPSHNLTLAFDYYAKAAENGYAFAMYNTWTDMYFNYGSGSQCNLIMDSDPEIQAVRRANQIGRQKELSFLNISCDVGKAKRYAGQAARMGALHGMWRLADIYEDEGDFEKAAYWYSLMSQWEPSDEFYADIKDYGSLLFSAWVMTHDKAMHYDTNSPIQGSAFKTREKAKQELKRLEEELGFSVAVNKNPDDYWRETCGYNDFSWYYKCKGDKL